MLTLHANTLYPRIRFGVSVQIKTKREPEISFYFIKVNFCRDLDRKMRAELVGPNVDKKRVYWFLLIKFWIGIFKISTIVESLVTLPVYFCWRTLIHPVSLRLLLLEVVVEAAFSRFSQESFSWPRLLRLPSLWPRRAEPSAQLGQE